MADISAEITAFKNAVYGEDVRAALVSLAGKLNSVVTTAVDDVNNSLPIIDVLLDRRTNTIASPAFFIKNILTDSSSFDMTFMEKGSYAVDNNKLITTDYRMISRARSKGFIYTPFSIKIETTNPSRIYIGIYNFEEDTYIAGSWSLSVTIPANTFFYILCDYDPNATEDISLSEILSAFSYTIFSNNIQSIRKIDKIDTLNEFYNIHNTMITMEHGGISSSTGKDTTYREKVRLRMLNSIKFPYSMLITPMAAMTNVGMSYYSEYDDNGDFIRFNGPINDPQYLLSGKEYRILLDGDKNSQHLTEGMSEETILAQFIIRPSLESLSKINMPFYYMNENYINNKIRLASSYNTLNSLSFGFITDIHMSINRCSGLAIAKYIKDTSSLLPFMIFGGDVPRTDTGSYPDGLYNEIMDYHAYMNLYGEENVYPCRGNHDLLTTINSTTYRLLWNECRKWFMTFDKNYELHFSDYDSLSYYFDIIDANTRIIVLDVYAYNSRTTSTGVNEALGMEQIDYDWLCDEALKTDNYNIIIVTHQAITPLNETWSSRLQLLYDTLQAFKNKTSLSETLLDRTVNADFSEYTGELIFGLSGHLHKDVIENDFIPWITTTCDCLSSLALSDFDNAPVYTINENAFDLVNVDFTNRIVHLTRIGRGNDRSVTF